MPEETNVLTPPTVFNWFQLQLDQGAANGLWNHQEEEFNLKKNVQGLLEALAEQVDFRGELRYHLYH